ncbi:unnamed protein product [Phytomonas sp. Hart1]|nr:unnamed protein product [Phytomonas sp. Hart1]|eukprot:CCW71991.1 unnamed protein product [Phytomonas sp. isolate Hart1]
MPSEEENLLGQPGIPPADYHTLEPADLTAKEDVAIASAVDAVKRRQDKEKRVLLGALGFCAVFMIAEFSLGVMAHSLALITDAVHLFTDVGAYALSIGALLAAGQVACGKYNYGWSRAEVIGTLISVISIWALVIWILSEALNRIYDIAMCARVPGQFAALKGNGAQIQLNELRVCKEIKSPLMIVVGLMGLVVNIVCALILYVGGTHGHSHGGLSHAHAHERENQDHDHAHEHSPNHEHSHGENKGSKKPKIGFALNAALLHALGDCVQSVGVIIAGLYIYLANRYSHGVSSYKYSIHNLADPISSILFSVITLKMTLALLFDLINILMESTPSGIDYDVLKATLLNIKGVRSVHDLHVWSLSADNISLSAHLVAEENEDILNKAKALCLHRFGISHTTIQLDGVENGASLCEGSCQ